MQEPRKTSQGQFDKESLDKVPVDMASVEEQANLAQSARAAKTRLTLDTALALYNMSNSKPFYEHAQGTCCLVGWGNNTVVVAFRGTASGKNVVADLQVASHLALYSPEKQLLHGLTGLELMLCMSPKCTGKVWV